MIIFQHDIIFDHVEPSVFFPLRPWSFRPLAPCYFILLYIQITILCSFYHAWMYYMAAQSCQGPWFDPEIKLLFLFLSKCLQGFTPGSPVSLHFPKTLHSKLPLGVHVCVCIMSSQGLVFHPRCIPHVQCSQNSFRIHRHPDHNITHGKKEEYM